MPPLTRIFIKSSLLYFVLSVLLAVLLAARAPFNLAIPERAISPVYFHLFLVGWVAQLIFGIVYWMFPKYSKEQPRGNEKLAWSVFWLLNIGLALRVIGEPGQVIYPGAGWGWVLAASALLQWLAGMFFVFNTWGRVKER
jgi:cbb3-type cytochrome oxidase subunit 1